MKINNVVVAVCIVLGSSLLFYACNKNNSDVSAEKARMQVYLTDDPAGYDAILLDIEDVKINYSSDTANGWISLANVNRGLYDVLRLIDDQDTLLANAELNTGRVEQLRLVLGSSNSVRVNGVTYPLNVPSGEQSGLKINLHQHLQAGILYKLLLDFDAARSVVKTGNGQYKLKPVVRAT
ncbi:MAG: DUF4382 domain-containing protein, partial [Chitinophagaceae bacterium]|nr:DUF4382 domain-containing protein [Chitinophagaceae bacterium]